MSNKTTYSVFFSPTGTSRSVIQSISRGVGRESETILDITRAAPSGTPAFSQGDLVVVGMPVYGGRLPSIAVERFQSLEGNGASAVAVVVYGNRAYEDALAELCDLCVAQGFTVVAAAAFVGQHSFSSLELPIAHNRPDRQDIDQAERFGRQIQLQSKKNIPLNLSGIPGNRPYKPKTQPSAGATETDPTTCTQCGACAASCPVQCIQMVSGMPQTSPDGCIWCMACVQVCPTGARKIVLPKIHESAQRLHTNFNARREPEIFHPLEK